MFVKSPAFAPPNCPTVIVFEKRPRWAPELERQFLSEDVRVIACRSVKDLADRAAGIADGALLLDAAVAPADCLQYLREALSDPRGLPVFVVGAPAVAPLEWTFRELGARGFFAKKISGHEMAALCRRQWTRRRHGDDRRERSGRQRTPSAKKSASKQPASGPAAARKDNRDNPAFSEQGPTEQ